MLLLHIKFIYNKLFLIIQREYFSRVKKKSFLIMTLLGPLLMAGVMIVPIWLSMRDKTEHQIFVLDHSGLFIDKIPNTKTPVEPGSSFAG